jgi:FAD/FMN-containing dehydrogenase
MRNWVVLTNSPSLAHNGLDADISWNGGGSGLMGGAMGEAQSVLIDFKDMAAVLAIRREDRLAVVQPGVVLSRPGRRVEGGEADARA